MPMTVDLGDLLPVVDRLVESGRYPSRDAVMRQAVRLVQQREADRDALLAELQVGLDDLEAGRVHDAEEVFAFLAKRYESRDAA